MKIRYWFTIPLIVFSLLYPSGDESLEECGLIIAHIYLTDDFYDPEYFEALTIEEAVDLATSVTLREPSPSSNQQ